MITIDMAKYNVLASSIQDIEKQVDEKQKEIDSLQHTISVKKREMKNLLPKGYWYTYDIDEKWNHPKKYSVKEVSCGYVTVKEVFKKKPWLGFTGEHVYRLENFLNLSIHKTEEEATEARKRRICPKCGNYMGLVQTKWCRDCMKERERVADEFNSNHRFYEPITKSFYHVKYDDELTRDRGYNGKSFVIRRLDTNEIIHTSNLWSWGSGQNVEGLPEIKFITEDKNEL